MPLLSDGATRLTAQVCRTPGETSQAVGILVDRRAMRGAELTIRVEEGPARSRGGSRAEIPEGLTDHEVRNSLRERTFFRGTKPRCSGAEFAAGS
jgi:hypothetical protein